MKIWIKSLLFISLLSSMTTEELESGLSIVPQSVESVSTDDEEVVEDTEPFEPTSEWQPIRKGQVIPAGLHIRVNLQTGLKEAKILDKSEEKFDKNIKFNEKHKKVVKNENIFNSKSNSIERQYKSLLKTIQFKNIFNPNEEQTEDISEDKTSNFRHIDEIKKDFNEMNVKIQSESELLKGLVEKYNKSSVDYKLSVLSDIEYLVHSVDIGRDFVQMKGIDLLLPDLNSSDSRLRAQIAFTLGSAMTANPTVQIEVFKSGALKEFLLLLRYDLSEIVKKRSLFAISSLVRHFPTAQKSLIQDYGALTIFANLFKETDFHSMKLCAKVVTLLNDLLIERQLTEKYAKTDKMIAKLKQYEEIGLNDAIIREGFCDLIPNLLNFDDNDVRDKTIEAMNSFDIICEKQFKKNLEILQKVLIDFEILSKSERNDNSVDYFTDLYKTTLSLINKLSTHLRDDL